MSDADTAGQTAADDQTQDQGDAERDVVDQGEKNGTADKKADDQAALAKGDDKAKSDWRDGIEDQKVRDFAGRFTTAGEMARTALELRQKVSGMIKVPGKNATEEETAAFHKALGVPDSPDLYEVDIPKDLPEHLALDESSQESINGFKAAMHAIGAPPSTVNKAVNWYFEQLVAADATIAAQTKAKTEEASAALRKEWAGEYETNQNYAVHAARRFGDDGFVEMLNTAKVDGVKLGDHPAFLKVFASIGRRMTEDGFQAAMTGEEKQTVQEQIDDLTDQQHAAFAKGDTPKAERLDKQLRALYGQIAPGSATGRAA